MEIVLNENEIAKRETIDFSKTFANQLYARPIRLKNIKKIKTNFEFDLLGSIIVHKNKADDNTYERLFDQLGIDINPINNVYEILDGQHRIKAMQELFGEKVEFEVVVLENMAYEERVKYYHTYNEDRQSLTYGEKFKTIQNIYFLFIYQKYIKFFCKKLSKIFYRKCLLRSIYIHFYYIFFIIFITKVTK